MQTNNTYKMKNFTITRTTRNGVQEVLTSEGFRSRDAIAKNGTDILKFDKADGSSEVRKLRSDCRIPQIARSIILNYA